MSGAAGPLPVPRPAFHLSPVTGWLSDPNGLFHADGTYHAYYQHNPHDDDWGPMHWGHATSTDLLHWEHRPVALVPDDRGMIFSGSAVVDPTGHLGPGPGTVVAAYTLHHHRHEVQCLAISTDGGLSFVSDRDEPVLRPDVPASDFRDPRLLRWSGADGTSWWVMLLAVGPAIEFHTSPDLVTWHRQSVFSHPQGHAETWETPDLLHLEIHGTSARRWVLTVGYMANGPESPTGMRYYVGDFDGRRFSCPDGETGRPVDHGPDFYAAQSWSHATPTTWTGWLGNWAYARSVPSAGWRGVLAVPRRVDLIDTPEGLRLRQRPVASLDVAGASGAPAWARLGPDQIAVGDWGSAYDVTVRLEAAGCDRVLIDLAGTPERPVLVWEVAAQRLLLDLGHSSAGLADPWSVRADPFAAVLPGEHGPLDLRIVRDGACLEVFARGGTVVFSALLLPADPATVVRVCALGGPGVLEVSALRLLRTGG